MATGVAWMDGRSRVANAQAASGTSKAGQTKWRADGQADERNFGSSNLISVASFTKK